MSAAPLPALAVDERALLERTWRPPPGPIGWLSDVRHTAIGRRYLVTAFAFLALGGLEALAMRWQLVVPGNDLVGPDLYDQLFTVHGSTMMFLFAVPVMEGMGIYFVPLLVGTRNVAFPRANALGYYLYLFGGLLFYVSFAIGAGADAGWFSYTPLAGPEFSPGKRVDVWSQMITLTEASAVIVAVQLIVTTLRMRAPGMSLDRIPLFAWSMLVTAFVILFAMPAVMTASGLLTLDRLVGTKFLDPAEGGDALLWQHLFWFFGHPEVYIIFLPGTGMVSAILPVFTGRPVFGYPAIVAALVTTGFLSFGLWVHHMFATTVPPLGRTFFTAASILIAIPTGVQFFCWIASLARGRVRFSVPMLFVIGFLLTFLAGGLTGVMVAAVPIDLQVHDTFFVVAHFHYTLIGGAVFPLLGAVHMWFPKLTGRLLSERLGRWSFALVFVGFHATFAPLFLLGLRGMPRRVYTYPPELGWDALNAAATGGATLLALGVALFVWNVLRSLQRGAPAGPDPWRGDTLEWHAESPPAAYGFERIPLVHDRSPLWAPPGPGAVTGLRSDRPEVLVTRTVDAEPEHREVLPGPSIWPLLTAVGFAIGIVAIVFTPWGLPIALALGFVGLVGWYWPRGPGRTDDPRSTG